MKLIRHSQKKDQRAIKNYNGEKKICYTLIREQESGGMMHNKFRLNIGQVMTYFLSSGNSDLDTIVFNYHFELKKKCYSITNDTLYSFINGKPAEFSAKSPVTDVFVIKK